MGKQPFISHAVNGYSRYDVPESKAFTCTAGILYPVRIDFINARDRVSIEQGIDFRSNPLAVPTFNPYTIRLHRFWVPLQLYHPEMRTNSSKFDMNDLSLNWIPTSLSGTSGTSVFGSPRAFTNSLLSWLRVLNRTISLGSGNGFLSSVSLPDTAKDIQWVNADTYLAYWDIVRNYYSYSQWSVYSFAWPASWKVAYPSVGGGSTSKPSIVYPEDGAKSYFTQCYGNLEFLDAYFESQFYPNSVSSSNGTFSRLNLFDCICKSDLSNAETLTPSNTKLGAYGDGFPILPIDAGIIPLGNSPADRFSEGAAPDQSYGFYYLFSHPMAVVPSSPDRFSRLLPAGSSNPDVSISGVSTIPQLAVASRLQEYKDLLGAGGSRFSDWLETFFASKIEHVDRPKLLFSASQVVNSQIVINQAGRANLQGSQPLGALGGTIAFNTKLGNRQSYYFREPGYLIDMFSIRPVYYWDGIKPDYLNYRGSDYFNPIYNDIGYQNIPYYRIIADMSVSPAQSLLTVAKEPCFNEFRSSYDEVLGDFSAYSDYPESSNNLKLSSFWVQQRSLSLLSASVGGGTAVGKYSLAPLLFTDITSVNSPFSSNVEDNFFVNISYAVRKKNLVNKTFATRLNNR